MIGDPITIQQDYRCPPCGAIKSLTQPSRETGEPHAFVAHVFCFVCSTPMSLVLITQNVNDDA